MNKLNSITSSAFVVFAFIPHQKAWGTEDPSVFSNEGNTFLRDSEFAYEAIQRQGFEQFEYQMRAKKAEVSRKYL